MSKVSESFYIDVKNILQDIIEGIIQHNHFERTIDGLTLRFNIADRSGWVGFYDHKFFGRIVIMDRHTGVEFMTHHSVPSKRVLVSKKNNITLDEVKIIVDEVLKLVD